MTKKRCDSTDALGCTQSSIGKRACGPFSDISFVTAGKRRGFCRLRSGHQRKPRAPGHLSKWETAPVLRAGIIDAVESLLGPLVPLFDRERAAGRPVALGLLVDTAGSTYRKPGALMLIASNGDYAGLLSGGCLEGDLGQHALSVIDTGKPRVVTYDMRGGDDLIWGLGLGCEGAMHILLMRVGPDTEWQPLAHLAGCLSQHQPTAVGIVVESELPDSPVGSVTLPQVSGAPANHAIERMLAEAARTERTSWFESETPRWRLFALPLSLPPKLLLLGAGPDAAPVVDFAARLNWKVTLVDHRPAYADAIHFPSAEHVVHSQPEDLLIAVQADQFSAAVVMSHHLPSDLKYLRALAATGIPYIGLLGPAPRRERLLADLGADADKLRRRLHAPVGLALGGRAPESIALAIVSEIHAFVHARAQGAGAPVQAAPALVRLPSIATQSA
jgi:xanthine dehydrogenase accessory factor